MPIILRALCTIVCIHFLAACMQSTPSKAQEVQASNKIQLPDLTDSHWQLLNIQSMDDHAYTPDEPSKYQIAFLADGQLQIIADCNRGRGRWVQENRGLLTLTAVTSTRAACGPNSLSERFISNLGFVRSFVFVNGHIFLATEADGAILELGPL